MDKLLRKYGQVTFVGNWDSLDAFHQFATERIRLKYKYSVFADQADQAKAWGASRAKELVQKFNESRANARNLIEQNFEELLYAVTDGDFIDYSRLLSGEPECMGYFGSTARQTEFREIRLRPSYPNLAIERYFEYYTRIIDLIDTYERSGTRCKVLIEISYGQTTHRGKRKDPRRIEGTILLKDEHQILNLEQFCQVLMSDYIPALVRGLSFATIGEKNTDHSTEVGNYNECNYNPETPEVIRFPSLWFDNDIRTYLDKKNITDPHSYNGLDLLEYFQYPVEAGPVYSQEQEGLEWPDSSCFFLYQSACFLAYLSLPHTSI